MTCIICGRPATVSNCFGGACDPKHLWYAAPGETEEEATASLIRHRLSVGMFTVIQAEEVSK